MGEMSIGKSVPNLISYIHEFFHNFSQSPAISFELISFRVNFNSEIADEQAPPVSRHAPCRQRGLKPLSGQRVARPDSAPLARARRQRCLAPHSAPARPRLALTARRLPPRPSRRRPDRATAPTAHAPTAAVQSRVARTRRAAVSVPVSRCPRRLPCAGDEPPPSRTPSGRAATRSHAGRAPHCASGPRAISAQLHPVNFINF
jgi:hypothetical protein